MRHPLVGAMLRPHSLAMRPLLEDHRPLVSSGWLVVEQAEGVHVLPLGDGIDHPDEDCICGPAVEPVKQEHGGIGWIITHHSLDGREHLE